MANIEPTALEITSELLSHTGAALRDNDFDRLLPFFALPQHIETFEGRKFVSTAGEFRELFDEMSGHYLRAGVTRLERQCIEAAFKTNVQVEAMYETRIYRDETPIVNPYRVFCVIRQTDERWQFSYSMFGLNYTLLQAAKVHAEDTGTAP